MRISDWSSDVCSSDLGEDPWDNISRRYPSNTRVFGKVSNVTDYGAFVEIEPGVEGLVHVSEMDWTNKNVNPSKVVQVGDEVEVMVLDVDEERRRISLGMKQVAANPWETFAAIRSEEQTSELQSLMRISYAVFCLKKKTKNTRIYTKARTRTCT